MRRFFSLLIVGIALSSCSMPAAPSRDLPAVTSASESDQSISLIAPDGTRKNVQVEFARTTAEQERGLMGRTSLPESTGMLFVFDAPRALNFWMKNTLIPLDILYFDAQGALVNTATMQPCTSTVDAECVLYPSDSPAQYALEVPAGYVGRERIGKGWRLDVSSLR